MTASVLLLVLFAALLHAAWNALLLSGAGRMWSMTVMCVALAVTCALGVPFVAAPARASWGYLVARRCSTWATTCSSSAPTGWAIRARPSHRLVLVSRSG